MKKTQNAIIVYHEDSTDQSETEVSTHASPADSATLSTEKLIEKSTPKSSDTKDSSASETHATTNAILNLNHNPFYNDKRKWDDSFTVAEQKALQGNIVKAAKDNDGETYITLQEEVVYTQPPFSQAEEESQDSDDVDYHQSRKPGRKPMPDEESLSDPDQDPKVKRKAQNRAAQRAFRERKEKYVKELEIKIKQVQDSHMVSISQLLGENQQLRAIVYRLEIENSNLKGVPFQPYQSELNAVPHHSPLVHPTHQKIGNYPQIAPLITKQQLLPAYPPTSPALSTTSTASMTMPPVLPYPLAPSNTNQTASSPPTKKAAPKKVPKKQQQKAPVNQPLEYTFSISTPASLRPSHSDSSAAKQNQSSEPVKLVQLFPPSAKTFKQNNNESESTPPPESPSQKDNTKASNDTSSVVSTESSKRMDQLELDLIDCHIDPEGQSFCEKLQNEVCHDAFNRFLSEPLFDQMGKLNLTIEETTNEKVVDTSNTSNERMLNCQEVWFMLSQHKRFQEFTTEQLFEKVKKVARWSDIGPVLEESDLFKIMGESEE